MLKKNKNEINIHASLLIFDTATIFFFVWLVVHHFIITFIQSLNFLYFVWSLLAL